MKSNKENNKNPLTTVLSVVLLMSTFLIMAQRDTLYYDAHWRLSEKDSASFFRPSAQKENDLYRVQDYYISGQIQMNALSKSLEKDIWQGTVTWYNKDGSIFQEGNYENNRLEGKFITYLNDRRLVAIYANGRFVSGERNTLISGFQMYFEQQGDTLYEIIYDKHIKGIRQEFWNTKDRYRFKAKYYNVEGEFIGQRKTLPNGYYQGVEVFYYNNPMRIKEIHHYPYGQLLITSSYYSNGQIREEVKKEPVWSKTYYDQNGKKIGEIEYKLNQDRLEPIDGTELVFVYGKKGMKSSLVQSKRTYLNGDITHEEVRYENGSIKSETTYEKGTRALQISYDEKGVEIARMIYKDYRPFDGTEMQRGRTTTYKNGALVEETLYYLNSEVPKVKKTKTEEVYFDKDGKVLGKLLLEEENGYPKPKEGKRYSMDYNSGELVGVEEYKEGFRVRETRFRKRQVEKNVYKTFKKVIVFDDEGYQKIRKIHFYSNGSKQSDISFKGYKEVLGTFYDSDERQIGSYDYIKKEGTRYVFFDDSDELKLMEELRDGKTLRLKRYNYGKSAKYGQINPVLEEEIDVACCASFYSVDGSVLGKVTFKNQIPWEGQLYNHSARTRYTLENGKRNGLYQKLDYNQNVLEQGQFVNDQEEGAFNYYDYQGNLQHTDNYKAGKLDGKAVYYDKKGGVTSQMIYADGLPISGTKILGLNFGKEPNQETYKDGKIVEYISHDKNGKRITTYKNGVESHATAFYKDSDKKRLSYGIENGMLDGTVIRYDSSGAEKHRAIFSKGKLESGKVYITPRYQDNRLLYVEVSKDIDKLKVKFIDFDNKLVLKAEEIMMPGATSNYMNKLDLNLDYLAATRLY